MFFRIKTTKIAKNAEHENYFYKRLLKKGEWRKRRVYRPACCR